MCSPWDRDLIWRETIIAANNLLSVLFLVIYIYCFFKNLLLHFDGDLANGYIDRWERAGLELRLGRRRRRRGFMDHRRRRTLHRWRHPGRMMMMVMMGTVMVYDGRLGRWTHALGIQPGWDAARTTERTHRVGVGMMVRWDGGWCGGHFHNGTGRALWYKVRLAGRPKDAFAHGPRSAGWWTGFHRGVFGSQNINVYLHHTNVHHISKRCDRVRLGSITHHLCHGRARKLFAEAVRHQCVQSLYNVENRTPERRWI